MLLQSLVLSMLVAASGWVVVPAPPCFAHVSGAAIARHPQFCMQEEGVAEAAAAVAAADFTEDLLDALSTDAVGGFEEQPATFHKGAEGVELVAMPSFTNMQSVEAMRSRYALHENDTGSSQVQSLTHAYATTGASPSACARSDNSSKRMCKSDRHPSFDPKNRGVTLKFGEKPAQPLTMANMLENRP